MQGHDTYKKALVTRSLLTSSFEYFCRYFFKSRNGYKMVIGPHHRVLFNTISRTMLPPQHPEYIGRLIINIPPGYSKTEIAVICNIAYGMACNRQAKFLHVSSSERLVLRNSVAARTIIKSTDYQQLWPMDLKADMDSKQNWSNESGGELAATPINGQPTGFRAGLMFADQWSGSLIADDPIKASLSNNLRAMKDVNEKYELALASRLAVESVPIIIIMQRLNYEDLSGFLLRGGAGTKWHHLLLPLLIDNNSGYPTQYTHGIPIDHGLADGFLWPFKHNEIHLPSLKAHRRKYQSQYQQDPPKQGLENPLFTEKMICDAINRYKEELIRYPKFTICFIDPGIKESTSTDDTGIIVCSKFARDLYGVMADYSLNASPIGWARKAMEAYTKHKCHAIGVEDNQGGDMVVSTLRAAGFKGRIIRETAKESKAARASPIAARYHLGEIFHAPGLYDLENELMSFDQDTNLSDGKSPNRLDAAVHGLRQLIGKGRGMFDV